MDAHQVDDIDDIDDIDKIDRVTAERCRRLDDVGMATAEYAIATLAACGFAGLLLTLLKSGEVKSLLFGIVKRALSI